MFPIPLGKELLIRPVWNVRLPEVAVDLPAVDPSEKVLGFLMGKKVAYFSHDGKPIFFEDIMYEAAISDSMFINYSRIPESLLVRDTSGRTILEVPERGYPVIRMDRLFVIDPDRSGIAEWDLDGALLWKKTFISIITDLVVTDSTVLIGLLDGSASMVDRSGNEISSFSPSGSRIPAVYGCAVSPGKDSVAFISGIDPQRVTLYTRRQEHFRPDFQSDVSSDFRRKVFMEFSLSGRYLYFENEKGISVLDTSNGRVSAFSISGRVSRLFPAYKDSMFVLTRSSGTDGTQFTNISLLLAEKNTIMSLSRPGALNFLRLDNQSLYTGNESTVMKIDMVNG